MFLPCLNQLLTLCCSVQVTEHWSILSVLLRILRILEAQYLKALDIIEEPTTSAHQLKQASNDLIRQLGTNETQSRHNNWSQANDMAPFLMYSAIVGTELFLTISAFFLDDFMTFSHCHHKHSTIIQGLSLTYPQQKLQIMHQKITKQTIAIKKPYNLNYVLGDATILPCTGFSSNFTNCVSESCKYDAHILKIKSVKSSPPAPQNPLFGFFHSFIGN